MAEVRQINWLPVMLIKDLGTQCPSCPLCRGEAEKFLNLAKGGDFLILRGRISKRGGAEYFLNVIFHC